MMDAYRNPFLHGKASRSCNSQDENEIRDLGDALAHRFSLGEDVVPELVALPKELALAVVAQMMLRTLGFMHRTTERLRVQLTREAMLVGADEATAVR